MQKLKPFLTFVFNKIFKSQFFIYWILDTTIVLVIIFNVNVKFLSEGGKQAPDKGEFGDKGIVGELETIITSDNKYQGIEGDVSSENYSKNKNVFISELDNAMTTIRNMKSRMQKLEKRVHKEHKVMLKKANGKRARKPRDPNAPKSGFAKEGPVSDEMRKFLGMKKDGLISRTDVTKKIHEYCKAKNLQNPADKRHIKADAPLRKLLKMSKDDDLTFFNLQKFMKVHFPNKEGIYPTA